MEIDILIEKEIEIVIEKEIEILIDIEKDIEIKKEIVILIDMDIARCPRADFHERRTFLSFFRSTFFSVDEY